MYYAHIHLDGKLEVGLESVFPLSDGLARSPSKPARLGSAVHEQFALGAGQHESDHRVPDGVQTEVLITGVVAFAAEECSCPDGRPAQFQVGFPNLHNLSMTRGVCHPYPRDAVDHADGGHRMCVAHAVWVVDERVGKLPCEPGFLSNDTECGCHGPGACGNVWTPGSPG